jgi:predicted nucleotidyltransferase
MPIVMAQILFEDWGRNYQVPGLPYEETFSTVHPVVLDDVPTMEDLEKLLETSDKDTLTNPWSVQVLQGFQGYIPTTFKRVTQGMDEHLLEQCFGSGATRDPEPDRVLLQLQTEIEAKAATIDAALIHHRRERGTVVNKAHVLNRLYMIGRIYGHLKERDYPFLFGDLTDESIWDVALSAMKQQFIDYMLEVPQGDRRHAKKIRRQDTSDKEVKRRFVYVEWLKKKLGDDLLGVLLYGSAARTDDPALYSDFDNWVRVKDVARAHRILAGTCPSVLDGRVIESSGFECSEPEGSKHVGIHIFPDNEDYIIRHIKFLHDSREFLNHTRVLYGEFPFIKVAQDEVIERGISQAYMKLKTIAGSLNWAYSDPSKIRGKPSLFEFIVKNVRFFLQHSLNATEGPRFRGKEELNERLADKGIYIPEYDEDLGHIRRSLLYSMVSVLQLQKEFVESGRQPNLRFLSEKRRFEWDSPGIDDWRPYDD